MVLVAGHKEVHAWQERLVVQDERVATDDPIGILTVDLPVVIKDRCVTAALDHRSQAVTIAFPTNMSHNPPPFLGRMAWGLHNLSEANLLASKASPRPP